MMMKNGMPKSKGRREEQEGRRTGDKRVTG